MTRFERWYRGRLRKSRASEDLIKQWWRLYGDSLSEERAAFNAGYSLGRIDHKAGDLAKGEVR